MEGRAVHGFVSGRLFRHLLALLAFGAAVPAVSASYGPEPHPERVDVLVLPPWYIVDRLDSASSAQSLSEVVRIASTRARYIIDPELTETAQARLAAGASEVLQANARLRLVDLPVLQDSERESIGEHARLFLTIGMSLEDAKTGGKVWSETRHAADYRIGEGLRFLADRTGARYALLIAGSETMSAYHDYNKNTMRSVHCGLVDLWTGRLVWYNSTRAAGLRIDGPSIAMKPADAAQHLIAALFKSYPLSKGLSFVDRNAAESRP
jgi:hypothetical protein